MLDDIAVNLARARMAQGLSQEELGNQLGLSRQAVSKWERGESVPDLVNLMALADLYGMAIDEIVRGPRGEGGSGCDEAELSEPLEDEPEELPEDGLPGAFGCEDAADAPPAPPAGPATSALLQRPAVRAAIIGCSIAVLVISILGAFVALKMGPAGDPATSSFAKTAQQRDDGASSFAYDGRLMRVASEDFAPESIDRLSVDWYGGAAQVYVVDDEETGGMIRVCEDSTIPLTEDEVVRCAIKGRTLEVSSAHAGLMLEAVQHVNIQVPRSVADAFDIVDMSGLASSFEVRDITCRQLTLGAASDSVSVRTSGVTAEELAFSQSGRTQSTLSGSFKQVRLMQNSGGVKLVDAIMPELLEADVAGGDLVVTLPPWGPFAVDVVNTGGAFSCDFDRAGTARVYSERAGREVEALCYGAADVVEPLYNLSIGTGRISIVSDVDSGPVKE